MTRTTSRNIHERMAQYQITTGRAVMGWAAQMPHPSGDGTIVTARGHATEMQAVRQLTDWIADTT